MRVANAREEAPGVTVLDAQAGVGFSLLNERFGTRVRRDAERREIAVSLISGPFRKLENRWTFRPHPAGTEVDFLIDFEFRSRMLDVVLHANFDRAVNRLVACFEDRARRLYGPSAPNART